MFNLETIKAGLPLEGILASSGVTLRRGRGPCPICHTSDRSQALSVRAGRWKCFACGKGGSVLDLVAELEGLSLRDAIKRCAELAGIGPSTGKLSQRGVRPVDARRRVIDCEHRIWREMADFRDVLQRIADDNGQPMEIRVNAICAVKDCDATLDLMLSNGAAR